ncbi:MAG: ABC transporter substrate-binding protein, partial [Acidimicrobiales bacterium]
HDPEGAGQLLDEAGFSSRAPDGVRTDDDGTRLELNVLVSSFEPLETRAMQLAAAQLEELGVKLNVEPLDPATLRQRRQAPPGEVPPYDTYVSNIESHAHVDPDALYYFFHSPGPKGFGAAITGYTNPTFDAIVEEATGAPNEERRELLAEAQGILAEDAPLQVLYYPDGIWAYRTEAYGGWANDPGHGIFTKRSFLPGYEDISVEQAATEDAGGDTAGADDADGADDVATGVPGDDDGASSLPWLVLGALLVAGAVAAVVVSRRRNTADDE